MGSGRGSDGRAIEYFVSGRITVQVTSCFICLDSAALLDELETDSHVWLNPDP